MLPSGATETDYTVEVTGVTGLNTQSTVTATFTLKLKNPCIDSSYVTIQTVALVDQVYDLYDFVPDGFSWTHDPFTLNTTPITHSLCGDFTYEATFMGSAITAASTPVKYDTLTRTFTIYSEDFALIGAQPFTIAAHLTDYPSIATAA